MVTKNEFLEIVEKHLTIRNDGSVYIKDPALAKKYLEYLSQVATKEIQSKILDNCPTTTVNIKDCNS